MHRTSLAVVLAFAALASPAAAAACSDAGPPNWSCNDGGAAWISCAIHDDCPGEQRCHENGYCICDACAYGEDCTGAGCTCARQERPEPPDGCVVVQDSCGTYSIDCPVDAGPFVPRCTTDGAIPVSCVSNADCSGGLTCDTARGICDCPVGTVGDGGVALFDGSTVGDGGVALFDGSPGAGEAAGCSVTHGGKAPSALALLFGMVALLRRRRR